MSVTTQAQEFKRLRKYLNPYLKGSVPTAILNGLAAHSTYLVNSAQAVNDSLYVVTAQGDFLDLKLSDYGVTRDPSVGLSDDIFRTIGIQVKNRKQVRDLINNILDAVFGDQFVKATSSAQNLEPYALADGDTLIVNYDGANTSTIIFTANQFSNIAAATAQEVANAILIGLSNLGVSGSAVINNDGNGNYTQLISSTIGATSSVTVLGGSAQNVLVFPSEVNAGGSSTTQWTITYANGGNLKFTWTGGTNPNLGYVEPQQYVNIFGTAFSATNNIGSFPIIASQGGVSGSAYFEINNPIGTTGVVTQGTDTAVLFFTPIRETILSKSYYAALYQTKSNTLQIYMPATTQVIDRSRIGSAHLHGTTETPESQLVLFAGNSYPSTGPATYYLLTNTGTNTDYYIPIFISGGSNTDPVPAGFTSIPVTVNSTDSVSTVVGDVVSAIQTALPTLSLTTLNNVITITYPMPSTIPDAGPDTPTTLGPYVFDTQQGFVVGGAVTQLTEDVNGETNRVITVSSSVGFPNTSGYLVLNYGCQNQEGPIPYIATPSSGTILISPAYSIQQEHFTGESVFLITTKSPITLPSDGSYYQPFLTDTATGRVYAQNLIDTITAAGVNVVFEILYPNDIGLGNWGTQYSEVSTVYGP